MSADSWCACSSLTPHSRLQAVRYPPIVSPSGASFGWSCWVLDHMYLCGNIKVDFGPKVLHILLCDFQTESSCSKVKLSAGWTSGMEVSTSLPAPSLLSCQSGVDGQIGMTLLYVQSATKSILCRSWQLFSSQCNRSV